jgi:general secretion pathway protein G
MKSKHGFTLVEILIVVVILGILAAIVIPQFTDAATESKESSLRSDLQTIRSQIELYKIQHNDNLPTMNNGASTGLTFEATMTGYTLQDGSASTRGAVGALGPYMQTIPVNPFTAGNGVGGASASGSPQGWTFDTTTGEFHPSADTSGTDHTIL